MVQLQLQFLLPHFSLIKRSFFSVSSLQNGAISNYNSENWPQAQQSANGQLWGYTPCGQQVSLCPQTRSCSQYKYRTLYTREYNSNSLVPTKIPYKIIKKAKAADTWESIPMMWVPTAAATSACVGWNAAAWGCKGLELRPACRRSRCCTAAHSIPERLQLYTPGIS